MKRIFILLFFFIPYLCNAQLIKGQKLIGGNFSFSTNSGNSTQAFDNRSVYHNSGTGIGINPSIAKFINSTTLRGIGLVYNYNNYIIKEEEPNNGNSFKNIAHSEGINIFSQRFISLGNNFFFTIQASATGLYSYGKQSDFMTKAMTKAKVYSITAAMAPGLSYKINRRLLFDALLTNILSAGYQHTTAVTNYPLPKETKTHNNTFNISSSLSNTTLGNIGVGFRWLLKSK